MSDDEKSGGDATRAGGMRPPRLPLPSSGATPAAGRDDTGAGVPKPPAPPRVGEAPMPPDLPRQPEAAPEPEVIEEGTQIYVRPKVTLTRLGPPGHSGVIPLEAGVYRLGRSSQCEILLYSPGSSRMHASLRREERGWVIEPELGKSVLVDGESISATTTLGQKARLRLGGDDLLFLDETRPASSPAAIAPIAAPRRSSGSRTWLIVAAAALVIAALLLFVSRR